MTTTAYICARDALSIANRAILASTAKGYFEAAIEIFDLSRQCDIPELRMLAWIMQIRAARVTQQPRDAVQAAIARRMA